MVLFIRINKDGDLSEENLDDIDNLYKKCNLRKQEGFVKLYSYTFNNEVIELWGRNEGRNNIKNKFVFEFDKSITLYGTCGVILKKKEILDNLTISQYNDICDNFKNTQKDLNSNKVIEKKNDKDNNEDNNEDDSDFVDTDDESDCESNNSFSESELQPEDYVYSSEED